MFGHESVTYSMFGCTVKPWGCFVLPPYLFVALRLSFLRHDKSSLRSLLCLSVIWGEFLQPNLESVFPNTCFILTRFKESNPSFVVYSDYLSLFRVLIKLYLHNDVTLIGETWKEIEIWDSLLHFLLVEHALEITFCTFTIFQSQNQIPLLEGI